MPVMTGTVRFLPVGRMLNPLNRLAVLLATLAVMGAPPSMVGAAGLDFSGTEVESSLRYTPEDPHFYGETRLKLQAGMGNQNLSLSLLWYDNLTGYLDNIPELSLRPDNVALKAKGPVWTGGPAATLTLGHYELPGPNYLVGNWSNRQTMGVAVDGLQIGPMSLGGFFGWPQNATEPLPKSYHSLTYGAYGLIDSYRGLHASVYALSRSGDVTAGPQVVIGQAWRPVAQVNPDQTVGDGIILFTPAAPKSPAEVTDPASCVYVLVGADLKVVGVQQPSAGLPAPAKPAGNTAYAYVLAERVGLADGPLLDGFETVTGGPDGNGAITTAAPDGASYTWQPKGGRAEQGDHTTIRVTQDAQWISEGSHALEISMTPFPDPNQRNGIEWIKPDGRDWSSFTGIRFDIYNPAPGAANVMIAMLPWNDWSWNASPVISLQPGWNRGITVRWQGASWVNPSNPADWLQRIGVLQFYFGRPAGQTGALAVSLDNVHFVAPGVSWLGTHAQVGQRLSLENGEGQPSTSLTQPYREWVGAVEAAYKWLDVNWGVKAGLQRVHDPRPQQDNVDSPQRNQDRQASFTVLSAQTELPVLGKELSTSGLNLGVEYRRIDQGFGPWAASTETDPGKDNYNPIYAQRGQQGVKVQVGATVLPWNPVKVQVTLDNYVQRPEGTLHHSATVDLATKVYQTDLGLTVGSSGTSASLSRSLVLGPVFRQFTPAVKWCWSADGQVKTELTVDSTAELGGFRSIVSKVSYTRVGVGSAGTGPDQAHDVWTAQVDYTMPSGVALGLKWTKPDDPTSKDDTYAKLSYKVKF